MRFDEEDRELTIAGAALVALGILVLASMVDGQARVPDAVLLARISIHETGWADTGDTEAIYAVIDEGARREGMAWAAFAGVYSRRLVRGEVPRRWASELTAECTQPPSWPGPPHARWAAFAPRCRAVMARAVEVVSGERQHGCERPPHDWGGRVDRERARRLGLIEIDCSRGDVPTVGDYYVRPSLLAE